MALDHYVSQVHLRKFHSPALNKRLHAIRKFDLTRSTVSTKEVCGIDEGSTNAYLTQDRAIEEFLISVEPRYNIALERLRQDKLDKETVHVFAGFAAYVACCAPAAMRIHAAPLKALLESEATILDRQGVFGKAPLALGGKSLSELLADGTVHFTVDEKFPQALGISNILQIVSIWGNSPWEILINTMADTPFFTSDYPVAIERRADGIVNPIVPLAPDVCIRILPDVRLSGTQPDLSFSKFVFRRRDLKRADVGELNRLIVRCAEDLVFYRDDLPWIESFVRKHRHFHIEPLTQRIPSGNGFLNWSSQRIAERRAA